MNPTLLARFVPLLAALLLACPAAQAACATASGPQRTALLELYTSEGCSSCPPAERTLARLDATAAHDAAWIPLALHVGYWDDLGWADPYVLPMATERQRWLAGLHGSTVVYTPQVLVDGVSSSADEADLRAALAPAPGTTATAQVQLQVEARAGVWQVQAQAQSAAAGRLALNVALAQNQLHSRVLRGENSGSTLHHDHVARAWQGPVALNGGRASLQWVLGAPERAAYAQGELVAFVQDLDSGRVLQALRLGACRPAQD